MSCLVGSADLFPFAIGVHGFLDRAVHQQQGFGLAVVQAQLLDQHAGAAVYQLLVAQLHVHHLVALDAAQLDHDRGADHVQNHLLPSARLHARAAGDVFRSYNHLDGHVGFGGHGRVGVAGDAAGQDAVLAGLVQGADDVGRSARCGDADDGVLGGDVAFHQFFPAAVDVVFSVLHGVAQGGVASGNESDDQRVGHAEGGRNLRSVEYAQSAAGAGSHVEDAASLLHAGHYQVDQFLYLGNRFLYGQGHFLVFGVDVFQYFADRLLFQVVVERRLL